MVIYDFNSEELKGIQARLREAISQSGVRQRVIAKEIGVSAQTVSKYMKCNVLPSLDTLARLCSFVDVSADYILGVKQYENAGN